MLVWKGIRRDALPVGSGMGSSGILRNDISMTPIMLTGKKRQHDQKDDNDQYNQSAFVETAGVVWLLHS